jgi:cellulose synthase/poly-beta-1,6-N-acetylglucosamine synthase-like glycosyltransferase
MITGWIVFVALLAFLYSLLMIFVIQGWNKSKITRLPRQYFPTTRLSLIIPFRNESYRLDPLFTALETLQYPRDLLEIILVNDHSEDDTLEELQNYAQAYVQVIDLSSGVSGKKAALRAAVKRAKGDILVFTDADCIFPDTWLLSIAYQMENDNTGLLAGPVHITSQSSFLTRFQELDALGMQGVTVAGLFFKKLPFANGANLAIKKSFLKMIGGYPDDNNTPSGDDVFLMEKALQIQPQQVQFLRLRSAIVRTPAFTKWSEFFQQRLRWASKTDAYAMQEMVYAQGLVFAFSLVILVSLLLGIFHISLLFVGLGAFLVKCFWDLILLRKTAAFFSVPFSLPFFFIASLFYPFYFLIVGVMSFQKERIEWKGRSLGG